MTIAKITVWQRTLPLKHAYSLSGGRLRFESLDSTFVRIDCADGSYGFGEGCPWGHTYLPAFGEGIRAGISLLADALLGQPAADIDRVNRLMDRQLPGHPYVKSALDMALWDIAAKRARVPLCTLLGGADGDWIEPNSSISTGTPGEMVALVEQARRSGYTTHSIKIGGDDVAADIARIDAIESSRLDNEKITYDVNRAWTPAVAIEVMNSVAARSWFEQPCETLDQCTQVQRNTSQPIMLDECLHDFNDHLNAWRQGAGQGVKVKPNRLGGLTRARQVRDFGVSVGWQMHIEDVGGTVLADTAAIHLALSTPPENRLASWLCHPHLVDDFAAGEGARNRSGRISLDGSTSNGIGVEPPENWLAKPWIEFA